MRRTLLLALTLALFAPGALAGTTIRQSGSIIGEIDGRYIRKNGSIVGEIDGEYVRKNGSIAYQIEPNGTVRKSGSIVYTIDGFTNSDEMRGQVAAWLLLIVE